MHDDIGHYMQRVSDLTRQNEQWKHYIVTMEDHIESLIGEFGDDPTACLAMISEYIQLAQHYRLHPNAERTD
jgi:hypothetical protein